MYLTMNQFLLKEKQQTFRTGTKLIILAGSDVSRSCSRNRGARLSFFPKHNRHISRKFKVIFNSTFVLKTYFRHNSTFTYRKNKLYDKIISHPWLVWQSPFSAQDAVCYFSWEDFYNIWH